MNTQDSSSGVYRYFLALPILAVLCAQAIYPLPVNAGELPTVPGQIQYTGAIPAGQSLAGITFSIYSEQSGGAALWLETQNVSVAEGGSYSALLGAATEGGIPQDIFASGEARWLEVSYTSTDGSVVTQPRVLLVSVPYAMKAGDAQTLGEIGRAHV